MNGGSSSAEWRLREFSYVIMKRRGGRMSPSILRSHKSKKSQSCENLSTRSGSIIPHSTLNSCQDLGPNSISRGSDTLPNPLGTLDSRTSAVFQPVAVKEKGIPSNCYDCPVEVQAQQVLEAGEREKVVGEMHAEFKAKRKVVLSGLPANSNRESLSSFLKDYSCTVVSKTKDGSVRLLFPNAEKARVGLALLNSAKFEGHKLSASYGHPDSLLFVGNLPYTLNSKEMAHLFQPYGELLRCFVVCGTETGLSKGYGFVEFASREEAMMAKQQMATKVVGMRSLRVDFADNGMQTCEDLQSQTLFVDRLPKGFKDDGALRGLFSKYGTVNFCQVALTAPSASSRGFAFVDMSSAEEAERAQLKCNGVVFGGQEIRVSFGMPCRPGACILQHRNTVPYNPASKHPPASLKENFPLMPIVRVAPPLLPAMFVSGECAGPKSLPTTSLPPPVLAGPAKTTSILAAGLNPLPTRVSLPSSLPQSVSAPTVVTLHPHVRVNGDLASSKSTSTPRECSLHRKRPAPSDSDENLLGPDNLIGVYDKPYIGQHQQGIPYTHPLKRIRMEN